MAVIIGKLKCYFCKNKSGILYSVHDYGIYGECGGRIFYHPECYEMVQIDPEKYGHNWADKAIQIGELRKRNIEVNEKVVDEFQKKVEKLHQDHFERMMPKMPKVK